MAEEPSSNTMSIPDEEKLLREFLEMPLENTDSVFKKFMELNMPGAIHEKGNGDFQEFLYIPGTRKDRVVLVAHADTWWDSRWPENNGRHYLPRKELHIDLDHAGHTIYRNMHGHQSGGGLGADDRAGCAMLYLLYLLMEEKHSILVTEGEEHRSRGKGIALFPSRPELFDLINRKHQFAIQLDRENGKDFKCYNVGTEPFKSFISENTGYTDIQDHGRTDIVVLCRRICGVNFSIGYYLKHQSNEYLDYTEWKNTLEMVRNLLSMELPRFERPSD